MEETIDLSDSTTDLQIGTNASYLYESIISGDERYKNYSWYSRLKFLYQFLHEQERFLSFYEFINERRYDCDNELRLPATTDSGIFVKRGRFK